MFVYCDPKSWPKDPERLHLPEGWVIAVGVHPKHAMDFGDYYFDRLSKLLDSPAVTALGEVGIDCSEEAKPFGIQQSTLKWVLALARQYLPLGIAPRQRIHYTRRSDAYPGTYFGFSSMVKPDRRTTESKTEYWQYLQGSY
jgi:Tat protein secretion system quality control protein TatD with DNase activity